MTKKNGITPARLDHLAAMCEVNITRQRWDAARSIIDQAELEAGAVYKPLGMDSPVSELGLTNIQYELLCSYDLVRVRDLAAMTPDEFANLDNCGWLILTEIRRRLRRKGFTFWDD